MTTIHKISLDMISSQTIVMKRGDEILTVSTQGDKICIWYITTESDSVPQRRTFYIYGTGHEIESENIGVIKFIGTVFYGAFVFHIFYKV